MNALDNLIFTAQNNTFGEDGITTVYIPPNDYKITLPALIYPDPVYYSYTPVNRHIFSVLDDVSIIEKSIQKHWFDIKRGLKYINGGNIYSDFSIYPPYHLMYAFLLENTRMIQIFEKLIMLYLNDEILPKGKNASVVNWIYNTENLFFKELPNSAYRNINSQVRIFSEASRRNAYKRMFAMDLSFGDFRNNDQQYPYYKAAVSNNGFVVLFEQFLKELWQAYSNARNTSGMNTTDYQSLFDLSWRLQQMLMTRRSGGDSAINITNYPYYNLSREEFSSVIMVEWFFHIIEYSSPLVELIGCEATTPGERLIKIGDKVGIKAHRKSQALFDLAGSLAYILREIEKGTFTENYLMITIESQSNPPPATPKQKKELLDFLTIINNWELTTGHIIKTSVTPVKFTR